MSVCIPKFIHSASLVFICHQYSAKVSENESYQKTRDPTNDQNRHMKETCGHLSLNQSADRL